MTRRTTPESETEIISLYKQNIPIAEIIAKTGLSKATIFATIKRNGIDKNKQQQKRTPEQEQEIINLAKSGLSPSEIASRTGVPRTTVIRVIDKADKDLLQPQRVILNDEDRLGVIGMYLDGDSTKDIATHYDVSTQTVLRIVKGAGIELHAKIKPRQCTLDESVFDVITPDSAYWIGFIMTDGCLPRDREGSQAIAIHLATEDTRHVEKLRSFFKSTHAITPITSEKIVGGYSSFYKVRSKRMSTKLAEYGMDKSKAERFPTHPQLQLSKDFWRGVMDADGYIGIKDKKYADLQLNGHMPMLLEYQKWLTHNDIDSKIIIANNGSELVPAQKPLYRIMLVGSKAWKVVQLLYLGATSYLDRKMERAQNILATCK